MRKFNCVYQCVLSFYIQLLFRNYDYFNKKKNKFTRLIQNQSCLSVCLFVCCCIHIELATLKVLISKIMMRMSLVNFSSLLTNSLLVSKNSIINYRMMATTSKYLIEEPKYDFLRNLSIERTNIGVFTNGWNAHGKVSIIFQ